VLFTIRFSALRAENRIEIIINIMYYTIRHITRFRYNAPVSESVLEVRMQPREEGGQRCLSFSLQTHPRAGVHGQRDYLGNMVHHFDVPGQHSALLLTAERLVDLTPPAPLPEALDGSAWAAIDALHADYTLWEWLRPSRFVQPSAELAAFGRELGLQRGADPLSTLRDLTSALFDAFGYAPKTTQVDSPIDEALATRSGVCQDFTHIMLALTRELGIPCRYVSGYLFHRSEDHDRSEQDATHAWVEAYLPQLGWVGFDPTNNLIAGDRHIRTAIGRDYDDVPPTRGVFKGTATSELYVAVRVAPSQAPPPVGEAEQESASEWLTGEVSEAAQQ
jgi:transglutaminase-like putative cysteine protease